MIKRMLHTLLALAVIAVSLLALGSPAQASTATPPKPIAGAGFSLPAHPEKTRPGPAIHLKHHIVPPRKGGISTSSVNLTYDYAGGQTTPAASKVAFAGNMYNSNPPVIDANDHSLIEMTVQAGTGNTQAILEIGTVKQCNSCSVQLFASRWVNNVWGGSYIGSGDGWVDYSGNAANLGAVVTTGVSKNFQWIYEASTGRWWGYYDGAALGYYPGSLWTSASPSYTFDHGSFFQDFVEVYDDDTTVAPCTDGGTGILATGTGTRANTTALKYAVGDWVNMGTWNVVTNSSWYNTLPVNVVSNGGTGANAFLGGPGGC